MTNRIVAIHHAAVLIFLSAGGGVAFAQSPGLPATHHAADKPPSVSTPSTAQHPEHRAHIVYSQGQLEITANNSSLNQILHDVALQTGMKITGTVTDEQVYGKYGPAAPAKVLASLLDGTDSNMLLTMNASNAPAELILTPKQGGPTPPAPASANSSTNHTPQTEQAAESSADPATEPAQNTQAAGTSGQPMPPADPTTQQVYQRVLQLRAQQQSQAQQHSPQ
jgi:hypothetical protein